MLMLIVDVNVQYLSTRKSCNKELRRLRHEGCLQQTTELCADFSDSDFRDGGSAFQHMGPETASAKAREPYVTVLVRGKSRSPWVADRR